MFERSKWIWIGDPAAKNQHVNFFFETEIECVPEGADICIGCETKYRLFVNGNLAVADGGLFRESKPGCGYYDRVNIAEHLKKGLNRITVCVNYYGNGGRNNTVCPSGGLILESEKLGIYSDEGALCYRDTAYYIPTEQVPSYLYGGESTGYDARVREFFLCPLPEGACNAMVIGNYGDLPWGELVERPIPMLFFGDRVPCEGERGDGIISVKLPYAMHFSPYIRLKADGGEKIDMRSDRFFVNGGPGDPSSYRGHRAEYICRKGEQEFEMFDWIFGEEAIFDVPAGVEIHELGYRESGYPTEVLAEFECDRAEVNALFRKCVRTLKVCMRENFMDCPDRERGQWIGDVSVQAPQCVYLLDSNGLALLRKAIFDFIRLRKGDRLVGNVPGNHFSELPSQSLNAISEWGMIAVYYEATGDKSVLELAYEPIVSYLKLWEKDDDGVVLPRKGNWEWYDHHFNCDKEILNITWYYSALKFAQRIAAVLGREEVDGELAERRLAIERTFEQRYWNKSGGYYASGKTVDDRANAMAVLSGLCSQERYPRIRYILMSVFNCSVYMENYVLIALCEMGYKEDAFRRMMSRYQPLYTNNNSTLWEDFFHLGTRNHAWTGAPATVLLKYFVGQNLDGSMTEVGDISPLKWIRYDVKKEKCPDRG